MARGNYRTQIERVAGEDFVFEVSSRSEEAPHRVEMTQAGGHGVCTCHQFIMRVEKNRRVLEGEHVPYVEGANGKPLNANSATECRHIAACRRALWEWFMIPLLDGCEHGTTEAIRQGLQLILVGPAGVDDLAVDPVPS